MEYYDEIAKGYDELHLEEQAKKLSLIKKRLKFSKGSKILDVGCGNGISSDFECLVFGIDPSIELLRLNKSKNKANAEAESLPFKSGSFDIVISITAMQNFYDIKTALFEIRRVGKKYFALSSLKKSQKTGIIRKEINSIFKITDEIEEDKDIIFLCQKE